MTEARADTNGAAVEEERVQIGPRLPRSLVDRLRQSAERNGRTFNRELEIALERGIDEVVEPELPPALLKAVDAYLKSQGR